LDILILVNGIPILVFDIMVLILVFLILLVLILLVFIVSRVLVIAVFVIEVKLLCSQRRSTEIAGSRHMLFQRSQTARGIIVRVMGRVGGFAMALDVGIPFTWRLHRLVIFIVRKIFHIGGVSVNVHGLDRFAIFDILLCSNHTMSTTIISYKVRKR
jgi:hypothetical protein